jgi:hypothetical protein
MGEFVATIHLANAHEESPDQGFGLSPAYALDKFRTDKAHALLVHIVAYFLDAMLRKHIVGRLFSLGKIPVAKHFTAEIFCRYEIMKQPVGLLKIDPECESHTFDAYFFAH